MTVGLSHFFPKSSTGLEGYLGPIENPEKVIMRVVLLDQQDSTPPPPKKAVKVETAEP